VGTFPGGIRVLLNNPRWETRLEFIRMSRVGEPDDDLVKARMRLNRCYGMERIMRVKMEGVLEGLGTAAFLG